MRSRSPSTPSRWPTSCWRPGGTILFVWLGFSGLPLLAGLTVAVLRYRLFDVDRIVSRTLAVAAAFQPARRRIQQAVDRRFNRRRHDAGRIIEAFAARLRDQVDLTTLTADLVTVVDQTMQPTTAWLWLRPAGVAGSGPAGPPRPPPSSG